MKQKENNAWIWVKYFEINMLDILFMRIELQYCRLQQVYNIIRWTQFNTWDY